MGKSDKYVLAMYDVRGKQNFIYNGEKIKEIMGGSRVIADVFKDYLYPAAAKYYERPEADEVIYDYRNHSNDSDKEKTDSNCSEEDASFSAGFKKHMEERLDGKYKYAGEVVYEGGGNFLVLYRDAETCKGINRIFTANLLKNVGTLKVLCNYVEIDDEFLHYRIEEESEENGKKGDLKRLYEDHDLREAKESVIYPVNTLPFVQTDSVSARPYVAMTEKIKSEKPQKVTQEQLKKYEKYWEYIKDLGEGNQNDEKYLDKLVENRGTESLLAVIYIDGNGMGAKVQNCLKGKESYDECVKELRTFSAKIQKEYVDERKAAIDAKLKEKYKEKTKVRRTIVSAGDEMTIICNARDALTVVRAYFKGLPEGDSSCVGIAIFHSHAPYADAYRIAEECCESCKTYMKHAEISDLSFMDFHYCQGGIGISLESIRERESGGRLYSRPWRIDKGENDGTVHFTPVFNNDKFGSDQNGPTEAGYNYDGVVDSFAKELNKTARGNMKTLRNAAQHSTQELEMELKRIKAHSAEGKKMDFSQKVDGEKTDSSKEVKEKKIEPPIERERDLIYDITMIYDLWFAKEEEDDNKTSDVKD